MNKYKDGRTAACGRKEIKCMYTVLTDKDSANVWSGPLNYARNNLICGVARYARCPKW